MPTGMTRGEKSIKIYGNWRHALFQLIVDSIFIILLSSWILDIFHLNKISFIIGWILLPFLRLIRSILVPVFIANADGIRYTHLPYISKVIRWEEISEIRILTQNNTNRLGILLTNPEAHLEKSPFWKRFLVTDDSKLDGTPYTFRRRHIGIPLADAQRYLTEAREQFAPHIPKTVAIETQNVPQQHWWTGVPPEERKVQRLGGEDTSETNR